MQHPVSDSVGRIRIFFIIEKFMMEGLSAGCPSTGILWDTKATSEPTSVALPVAQLANATLLRTNIEAKVFMLSTTSSEGKALILNK